MNIKESSLNTPMGVDWMALQEHAGSHPVLPDARICPCSACPAPVVLPFSDLQSDRTFLYLLQEHTTPAVICHFVHGVHLPEELFSICHMPTGHSSSSRTYGPGSACPFSLEPLPGLHGLRLQTLLISRLVSLQDLPLLQSTSVS